MTETADLFEAVYRAPDDDAPREALARKLSADGDPRGEFIELQLASARSKRRDAARDARAKELLSRHRKAWLEPLLGVLRAYGLRWERGFVVAGRLLLRAPDVRERQVGLPALATLRSFDLDTFPYVPPYDWLERLIFDSPLRGLRRLRGLPRKFLPRLLRSTPPWRLESVEVKIDGGGGPSGKIREEAQVIEIREAFEDARGIPHLRALSLPFNHGISARPESYDWLWRTPAGRALEEITLCEGAYVLGPWQVALLEHGRATSLRRLVLHAVARLVLERGADDWCRLSGRLEKGHEDVARRDLASALEKMPGRMREVEVRGF